MILNPQDFTLISFINQKTRSLADSFRGKHFCRFSKKGTYFTLEQAMKRKTLCTISSYWLMRDAIDSQLWRVKGVLRRVFCGLQKGVRWECFCCSEMRWCESYKWRRLEPETPLRCATSATPPHEVISYNRSLQVLRVSTIGGTRLCGKGARGGGKVRLLVVRWRHFQTNTTVQSNLGRRRPQKRQSHVLEAALAPLTCQTGRRQTLPKRVGASQQDVFGDSQRVGAAAAQTWRLQSGAFRQGQRVGLWAKRRRARREDGLSYVATAWWRAAETDVGFAAAVVPLERLLRREWTWADQVAGLGQK